MLDRQCNQFSPVGTELIRLIAILHPPCFIHSCIPSHNEKSARKEKRNVRKRRKTRAATCAVAGLHASGSINVSQRTSIVLPVNPKLFLNHAYGFFSGSIPLTPRARRGGPTT